MGSLDIRFKKVSDWLRLLNEPYGHFEKWIKQISGASPEIVRAQKSWHRRILSSFGRAYDTEAEVIIARAPARVNLVGMAVHEVTAERSEHIDHRGGNVNPIAAKELVIVAQPRDDDYVVLRNLDSHRFRPRRFRISEELPSQPINDWLQWTEEKSEEAKANGTAGDWVNYVKAAACYLQELHRDYKKLRGMNALVAGNIPIAAG
jgi:galactokinase